MKKIVIVLVLLAVVSGLGCSTLDKEAVQKGYVYFDKGAAIRGTTEAILGAVLLGNSYGFGGSADSGIRWDLELMGLKYPECFRKDEADLFLGWQNPSWCVQEKAREEGSWR